MYGLLLCEVAGNLQTDLALRVYFDDLIRTGYLISE